jgi:SAM-dependent methyltransferase
MMSKGYRGKFVQEAAAVKYDTVVYAPASKSELIWRIEAELLDGVAGEMRRAHEHIDYLDFACGTGRILSFVEARVDEATGIDVSPAMLSRATQKVRRATLLCRDITGDGAEIEGKYDLISCFRFLKNAEPELRRAAVRQLARRLKGPTSVLVVNSHGGNPFSYRALLVPWHWLRARLTGRKFGDYLSNREVHAIMRDAGLVVERVIGYSFISGRILKLVPASLALAIERRLVGARVVQALGANQLFICRLARAADGIGQTASALRPLGSGPAPPESA